MGRNEEEVYSCKLDGSGLGQPNASSCWYASYALLFRWKGWPHGAVEERIRKAGLDFDDYYKNGLPPEDFPKTRKALGLTSFPGSYAATLADDLVSFAQLLKSYGPMWCAFVRPSPHIVVVTGTRGDMEPKQIDILNPGHAINADAQHPKVSEFKQRLNVKASAVLQCWM